MIPSDNLTFTRPATELPADSPEIAALAGHLRAGRCALFVGAGLSVPAKLPTWRELMDRVIAESTEWAVDPGLFAADIALDDSAAVAMREPQVEAIRSAMGPERFTDLCRRIQRVTGQPLNLQVVYDALDVVYGDSVERAELNKLLAQQRYAELAGHCRDRFGPERFHETVRRMLMPAGGLPATHRDIVRTPFSCVVTTNFDTLLEDAYTQYGEYGVPRAPTGAELSQQGTLLLDRGFFVLKAHGDAARPDTMIFTADDYRRVIHSNPAFQAIMSGILLTHAVLFVGYSLSDTNFRLLLDNQLTIFNGNVPPRYAILNGVGEAERDILWNTAKLQVLSYPEGQHPEVGRCLKALADQTTGAIELSGKSAVGRPAASSELAPSHATLFIDGDGDRLTLELVRRKPGHGAEREWIGGTQFPDTRRIGDWARDTHRMIGQLLSPKATVRTAGAALAELLPAPLAQALTRIPRRSVLEIVCTPAVARIPWEWMQVGRHPLCLRQPLVRRPAEITNHARGRRRVGQPLHALLIGDAGSADSGGGSQGPLPFADLEVEAIEAMLKARSRRAVVTRLSRESATHARVLKELETEKYDVIHFAGHAWFDDRESFFFLWDRRMLGSELAPLLSRRPPALVVLDTHYTAFMPAEQDAPLRQLVRPSPTRIPAGSARGFAEAAMRCGVTAFVGAFGNVNDRPGAELSVALYAELLTGSTVAAALRAARARTAVIARDQGLLYTAFGYPDFQVFESWRGSGALSAADALARAKARCRWPRK